MKKVYVLAGIVVLSFGVALNAYATNDGGQQGQQASVHQTSQNPGQGKDAVISGKNDKRVITPQMNYRERMEVQRAIQKRAAAKRNAMLNAAGARSYNSGGANNGPQAN